MIHVHCPSIVWNHLGSASFLLCPNDARFFKRHLVIPIFNTLKTYTNMFSMCLKLGVARFCLKSLVTFKPNKTDALIEWFHAIDKQYSMYSCSSSVLCFINTVCVKMFSSFHVSYIVRSFMCVFFSFPGVSSEINIAYFASLPTDTFVVWHK